MDWKTWQRPTLPWLEPQYHGRWGFSRPSSGWDRVQAPRHRHQIVQSMLPIFSYQSSIVRTTRFRCNLPRATQLRIISMHGRPAFNCQLSSDNRPLKTDHCS
jgi:hypothetical protein